MTVDHKLSWVPHALETKKSFANKLGLLTRSRFLPKCALEELYFKVILPSVRYGLVLWGSWCYSDILDSIERLHCRAARIIFLTYLRTWRHMTCSGTTRCLQFRYIVNYNHLIGHCGAFCGLKWRIQRSKIYFSPLPWTSQLTKPANQKWKPFSCSRRFLAGWQHFRLEFDSRRWHLQLQTVFDLYNDKT